MSDETPDIFEMENSPETANYRKSRLMLWEKILATHKDYIEDAKKAGASDEQARRGAGKHVRGEVRMLCSDILSRAPVEAIVKFLGTTRDWVDETENLITDPKANAALVELIMSSYPHRTWAKRIDAVTKMVGDRRLPRPVGRPEVTASAPQSRLERDQARRPRHVRASGPSRGRGRRPSGGHEPRVHGHAAVGRALRAAHTGHCPGGPGRPGQPRPGALHRARARQGTPR